MFYPWRGMAMSRGGITNFWRESKKKWKFPVDLLFLLDCTHFQGDWWLYLAEVDVWPPWGLKIPPRGGFTLREVQAMCRGGIINVGRKIQNVAEFSTKMFMSALLHTLPWWWFVAIPRQGQCLASQIFDMISGRSVTLGEVQECHREEWQSSQRIKVICGRNC